MTSESINRYRWQLKNYHWKDKIRELIKSNPLFSDFDDILFEDISIGLIKWNKIVSCFVYYNQCRNRIIYVISTSISIQLWYLNILRSFLNLRDPRFFFFFFSRWYLQRCDEEQACYVTHTEYWQNWKKYYISMNLSLKRKRIVRQMDLIKDKNTRLPGILW